MTNQAEYSSNESSDEDVIFTPTKVIKKQSQTKSKQKM